MTFIFKPIFIISLLNKERTIFRFFRQAELSWHKKKKRKLRNNTYSNKDLTPPRCSKQGYPGLKGEKGEKGESVSRSLDNT